jgi:hypothetical protein
MPSAANSHSLSIIDAGVDTGMAIMQATKGEEGHLKTGVYIPRISYLGAGSAVPFNRLFTTLMLLISVRVNSWLFSTVRLRRGSFEGALAVWAETFVMVMKTLIRSKVGNRFI